MRVSPVSRIKLAFQRPICVFDGKIINEKLTNWLAKTCGTGNQKKSLEPERLGVLQLVQKMEVLLAV